MRALLLIIVLLCCSQAGRGQVSVDTEKKIITIDASIDSAEVIVEKGKYTLILNGANSFSVKKGAKYYDALSTDFINKSNGNTLTGGVSSLKLEFGSNTEYTIIARTDDSTPKERKYIIRSQSNWSWSTTLGANAIVFTDRSKFISREENGIRTVAAIQYSKQMELMPAIVFTFMKKQDNVSFGFSGGLGLNFEKLSVFTGLSLGIGQNIVLTGGVAAHKQNRPNNHYYEGQVIDNSISNDILNQEQYRVNPFIGISFRFDKNPF